MELSQLFKRCVYGSYVHVEESGDYALERRGNVLYIYLESSDGPADWKHNLAFPAKPYRRMGKTVWFAHGGFLRVWKAVEPYLEDAVANPELRRIVTVGYSHGAALAVFCHEYVWYHRPDLRQQIEGYGFGCPRVFWGLQTAELRARWSNFLVVRNIDDAVTHLPPSVLGYSHVGRLLEIGGPGRYSRIDAHRPENILRELEEYEKSRSAILSIQRENPLTSDEFSSIM